MGSSMYMLGIPLRIRCSSRFDTNKSVFLSRNNHSPTLQTQHHRPLHNQTTLVNLLSRSVAKP